MYPRITFLNIILLSLSTFVRCQVTDYDTRCNVIRSESNHKFEQWLSTKTSQKKTSSDEIYRIPVVVHIIHNGETVGEGTNISDEQIHSQIRVINEDFRRKEGTRGYNTHPDGSDAKIEFVLAKSSPEGLVTDGIIRVNRNLKEPPSFGGNMVALGAYYSIWNPDDYLNIWAFPGLLDFNLGDARFPVSDLPGLENNKDFTIPGIDSLNGIPVEQIDGVAINTFHFGETSFDSEYNLGRTGTHEIGHFLGLFHIWGDEGFEGSCDIDDYCEDTPPTDSRTIGCPVNKIACDSSIAMIENYMDYTNDECMNIFTNEQVERMRTVLENSPRRKSLLTSKGLFPPDEPNGILSKYKKDIKIYPNPALDYIIIELPELARGKLEVSFYNLSGMLLNRITHYNNNNSVITIDIPYGNCNNVLVLEIVTKSDIIKTKIFVNH